MKHISRRAGALLFAVALTAPLIAAGPVSAASSTPEDLGAGALSSISANEIYGPCPTDPNIRWKDYFAGVKQGVMYTVISATPTFYVSDGRVVDNLLDTPIAVTFTSNQSQTYTVTVASGASVQLTEKLQSTVSVNIQMQRTTAIGVSAALTVPPRTRVTGQYGVEGFDVVYDKTPILKFPDVCMFAATERGSTAAPTVVEGWRFSSTPL